MEQQLLPAASLLEEVEQSFSALINTLETFPEDAFNTIPFTGSWTAGQVCDHLYKSVSRMPELIKGPTEPTTGRQPDEFVGTIKATFLDFGTKLHSPEFILPGPGPHDRSFFINGFRKVLEQLKEIITTTDLSVTVSGFSFPTVGNLTAWEWLWFGVCHTKRHTHQLKNIAYKLAAA